MDTHLDLTDDQIREILGGASVGEIANVHVVLRTIKKTIGLDKRSNSAHHDLCWTWGPDHYFCAYTEIRKLLAEKAAAKNQP